MLDLMLFQAVVFITPVSAKKDTCSQQLRLKSAFWGPRMFSCSYTGGGRKKEKGPSGGNFGRAHEIRTQG